MNQTGRVLRAAPWVVLAGMLHLLLLGYLACWRFPYQFLKKRTGQAGPSFVVSASLNLSLLLILAMLQLAGEFSRPIEDALVILPVEDVETLVPPALFEAAVTNDPTRPVSNSSEHSSEYVVASRSGGDGIPQITIDDADLSLAEEGSGDSDFKASGQELGRELREGSGAGQGGKADFFGVSAYGTDFVFVVDMSGSMQGHRFRRARTELRRSIEALGANQRFYIVFYSSNAYPMPTRDLLEASKKNLGDAVQWINKVEPIVTNPLPAVLIALNLKPDAVFLLSDGEFGDILGPIAAQQYKKRIPIHTIGFESRVGERLLKAIAQQTGANYRFVR